MDLTFSFKFFSIRRVVSIKWQWIQFAIIVTVILASMAIAFWGSPLIYILILVLLIGSAGVVILMGNPNLGFILTIAGGMFVPFTGPSGLNMANVGIALMLGLWIMDMFVVKRYFTFIRSRIMVPIITFLMISIFAFGMGQIPWFVFARQAPLTAQVGGFAVTVFSIGGLLLAAHMIKDLRWLKIIVWSFLGMYALYMISRTLNLSFVSNLFQHGFTAQSMSWTWLVTLAAGQIIYNDTLSRRVKAVLIVLVLMTFYVSIVQGYDWKSGWVPPLLALFILLGVRYRNLIVFSIPFIVMAGIYLTVNLIASDEYSWGTRTDAWRIVLEISRISPLLGMGFANYYWYTPLFPIRGWRVNFNSHSQYVDLIAQNGYLGLIAFFWLFFAMAKLSFDVARRLPGGFARAYAYSVFAGIIATLVAAYLGDWVLSFVYNVGLPGFRASILPWIFMGGVIAIDQMTRRNPQGIKNLR